MSKLSNEFKQATKEIVITSVINALGYMLRSIGEALVNENKFKKDELNKIN